MPGPTWAPMTGLTWLWMTGVSAQPGSLRMASSSHLASFSASDETMAMGWLLGRDFSWDYILKAMRGVAKNSDWKTLLSLSGDVVVCFILGGLALAAVLTPITYFAVRTLVRKYRSGRIGNGNRLP